MEIWRFGSLTHKLYKSQFTLINAEDIFSANIRQNIRVKDEVRKWIDLLAGSHISEQPGKILSACFQHLMGACED